MKYIIKNFKDTCKEHMKYIIYVFIFIGSYSIIQSTWIIAEQAIEGTVVTTRVDIIISIILAAIVSNKLNKYIDISK